MPAHWSITRWSRRRWRGRDDGDGCAGPDSPPVTSSPPSTSSLRTTHARLAPSSIGSSRPSRPWSGTRRWAAAVACPAHENSSSPGRRSSWRIVSARIASRFLPSCTAPAGGRSVSSSASSRGVVVAGVFEHDFGRPWPFPVRTGRIRSTCQPHAKFPCIPDSEGRPESSASGSTSLGRPGVAFAVPRWCGLDSPRYVPAVGLPEVFPLLSAFSRRGNATSRRAWPCSTRRVEASRPGQHELAALRLMLVTSPRGRCPSWPGPAMIKSLPSQAGGDPESAVSAQDPRADPCQRRRHALTYGTDWSTLGTFADVQITRRSSSSATGWSRSSSSATT